MYHHQNQTTQNDRDCNSNRRRRKGTKKYIWEHNNNQWEKMSNNLKTILSVEFKRKYNIEW